MQNPFDQQTGGRDFVEWSKRAYQIFPFSVIGEPIVTPDILFSKVDYFKQYKGKSVLIIGGGPSASELDYSNVEADYIWSVNHFFLHPILKNTKIDLAMIMAEPNIYCKEFLEYRDKYNPMIGFEIHEKWVNYKFDDYENYFLMNTHFYGRLGACTRMIIFAALLGVSDIKFVGMDGDTYMKQGDHAFEPNKKNLPSTYNDMLFPYEYRVFWDYVDSNFSDIKIENLGFGKEYHNR